MTIIAQLFFNETTRKITDFLVLSILTGKCLIQNIITGNIGKLVMMMSK